MVDLEISEDAWGLILVIIKDTEVTPSELIAYLVSKL